jgi:hypothetical protein
MFRHGIARSLQHRSWLALLFVVPAGFAYAGAISVDVVDAVTIDLRLARNLSFCCLTSELSGAVYGVRLNDLLFAFIEHQAPSLVEATALTPLFSGQRAEYFTLNLAPSFPE